MANHEFPLPIQGISFGLSVDKEKPGNTAPTKFNIGAAASATLGVEIAEGVRAFWIPIDDVSQLYFYSGGATDIVDITYLRG